MTPPSDPQVLEVVDRYRTCEFATLTRSGVPITWPTAVLYRSDGTFLITTSIALPQKAYNIRRDDRVALLFSEPTGSGMAGAPQVLVQGRARCPDEIVTDVAGAPEYWRRLHERQPFNHVYSRNVVTRRLFDWYYMRLLITVTPTAWITRPPLPAGPATVFTGVPDGVSARALAELAAYPSAVLATRTDDGMPSLQRARVTGPGAAGRLRLDVPPDESLREGPASLLAHGHDERLWSLRSVVVTGELIATDVWTFQPERVVDGAGAVGPFALVREIRRLRRAAAGYLEKRSLPRPDVAWNGIRALGNGVRAAGTEPRPEPAAGRPSSP
ncbi:pyridoxamine 5'-phosphate oxidase [Blastococcus colisei]|uniref:Pyridoxamine 5'-phosphate oxidase n=1 Tax=Blastococcus colisei TaxID=1564162 RepID=A0A543PIR9_9ACTN|nr:pyridoxamine 5'-phosphate oxidase family protein [Blastococcus colisei]TQN43973.1 pyridoxamine 5'-phosphate oxidase [Blastococcus colisei]